jgi:nucleotide-binding universal stress UspA family protein
MKFLIGYNGSAEARAALSLARDFAKIFNAKVFVMASMEGGAGEKIEDINQAEQNGLTPGEDLVKFAEENQIDQIYVGIEKKSKTSKLLLGSTAQYVILKAPCPVIAVK